jgi:hypothetical protein
MGGSCMLDRRVRAEAALWLHARTQTQSPHQSPQCHRCGYCSCASRFTRLIILHRSHRSIATADARCVTRSTVSQGSCALLVQPRLPHSLIINYIDIILYWQQHRVSMQLRTANYNISTRTMLCNVHVGCCIFESYTLEQERIKID